MIKFVKDDDKIPAYVYGTGYGWRQGNKEQINLYVTIINQTEKVTLSADDVPALLSALESAVAEAKLMAQKDLVKYKAEE